MIAVILMASGFGRRFGSNKLLYEINGKPMYCHILERMHGLSLRKIEGHVIKPVVVTQYDDIMVHARKLGFHAVFNEEAMEGIAASVRKGVEEAGPADWYVFLTADQPYLEQPTIESFIRNGMKSNHKMASVFCKDQPGNPTMFHGDYRDSLLLLRGDKGGRKLMKANPEEVFWYEIDENEIKDIDFLQV